MATSRSRSSSGMAIVLAVCCVSLVLSSTGVASVDVNALKVPEAGITQILRLGDGTELIGKIVSVADGVVTFKASVGEIKIASDQIVELKELPSTAFRGGRYWYPNPNRTRLFLGPTGRTLRQGEGYFSDVLVFFPGIAYGLTDNISIGGGVSLFPGVDFGEQIFYVTPKVGFRVAEHVDLAVSGLIIRVPDIDDDSDDEPTSVGVLYGVATLGTENMSLTGGVGFGYADDEVSDKPAVMIGGEARIARRLSLVSENWIVPEVDPPIVSYGVRFFGEALSVDLALFNALDEDAIFPGIPFVDFVWNF